MYKNGRRILSLLVLVVLTLKGYSTTIGPWNMDSLNAVPEWETTTVAPKAGMTGILYHSISYKGKPVQVFAYYSVPDGDMPEGGWPAVVYAHGGGGTATHEWVGDWNERGYASISMDLEGHLPINGTDGKRLATPNPGPSRVGVWDDYKLPIEEQWYYHAVAQIIRAHSLIASFPEVNADKIGLSGISWGGTLTSTVMGLDARLKFAIPIYGAGFLSGSDAHQGDAIAAGAETEFVNTNYDGNIYFNNVTFPTLWVNGTNDNHFSLTCTQQSSRAVQGESTLLYSLRLSHGGNAPRALNEIFAFADYVIKGADPLVHLYQPIQYREKVAVKFNQNVEAVSAQLLYTFGTGDWEDRYWYDMSATISGDSIVANIPDSTTAIIFTATDSRGLMVTSEYLEIDPHMEESFQSSDTLSLSNLPINAIDSTFFKFVPKVNYGTVFEQDGTSSFTTEYQPAGSPWGEYCNEEDVYLARLKHTSSADNTWDLRIGKGGQIYSFIGPYGEGVPPSSKERSRWNDEVWQPVSVSGDYNDGDAGASSKYFIHGAGNYINEDSQTGTFYSPLMASYYNETENAYSVTNWGQQAHVPSLFKSGLLYTTKYRDVGEGILEVTYVIQNFGNDVQNHLNVPWGGVRSSSLRGQFISLPDNTIQASDANTGTQSGLLDIDETAGYFLYAADTVNATSPSMGIVFGNEVRKNEFSDNNLSRIFFRFAQVGGDSNPRDYSLFVVIPKIEVNPGETFYYRVFYVNGNRTDVHEKSKELVQYTDYGFINPPVEEVPIVTIKTEEIESALTQDINLYASPVKDMIPLFLMENSATGEQYISPDLYYNVTSEPFNNPYSIGDEKYNTYQNREINRPYDGKVKYLKLLGYGVDKDAATSTEIRYALLDTMIVNSSKVVLTNEYKNRIYIPISSCKNCNESDEEEEQSDLMLYNNFSDRTLAEYGGAVAVTYNSNEANPNIEAGHANPLVGKVVRSAGVHANIRFDLPANLDFSVKPTIEFKGYFESQEAALPSNCKITLILRNSASGGSGQHTISRNFEGLNQWETFTFDCSGAKNKGPYNQIWLFFSMSDNSGEATGQVFYIDDLKGPALTIGSFDAYTSDNGKQITLDLSSNSADLELLNDPSFQVVQNGKTELGINTITNDNKHVYINLDASVAITSKDILTITFNDGEIVDTDGKSLPYFVNENVTNNVAAITHQLTFMVSEAGTNKPMPDVSVAIGALNYQTNAQGIVTVELDEGDYNYEITKENYITNNGSLNLTSDKSFDIALTLKTGLNAVLKNGTKVFPNPATGHVNVQSHDYIQRIAVLNSIGQSVATYKVNEKSYKIDTQNLNRGFYFLQLDLQNGQRHTKMIQLID